MEMHLLHRRTSYDLAVIAVLIEEGEENTTLAAAWSGLPAEAATPARTVVLDLGRLLPKDLSHYAYSGSLTMPPCSEVVRWLVLRRPLTLSIPQIEAFRALFDHNYRPVQPLNGRAVQGSP
jgi:carbonic anhydrase